MATTDLLESGARAGEEFRVRAPKHLPMDEVRRLSVLAPGRATLSLIETWGTIALAVTAACLWPRPWVVALVVLVVASRQHALAILAHQSAHYRMYQTRWLNDLAGQVCGTALGVSMLTYRIIHRIHHNHLYSPIDPDLAQVAGYPRGRAYLAKKLLKDLCGVTTVKNYLYFFGKPQRGTPEALAAPGPVDDTSTTLKTAARRERIGVVGVQLVLLTAAIATGTWRAYLVLWLLPLVTVLQLLLRLRAVCEHGAPSDTSTPLRAARTTLASPLVRWFVFPHQMHFHIEHHLYPAVPHYRLPECHRALAAAGGLDEAEVVPTFGQTLGKIFADV